MADLTCPYCRKPCAENAERCNECQALFPWATELAALKEEIKSREVNRGRATFTLIEEMFGAAKGGKPVTVAALKGFAFAWLFPRAVIVLGSVLGVIVLVAQTWLFGKQTALMDRQTAAILRQTELMAGQADAANFDQIERVRSRITANLQLGGRLEMLFTEVKAEPRRWLVGCDKTCQSQSAESAAEELRRRDSSSPSKGQPMPSISPAAAVLERGFMSWNRVMKVWDANLFPGSVATTNSLMEEVSIRCAHRNDSGGQLGGAEHSLRDVGRGDAMWRVNEPRETERAMGWLAYWKSFGSAAVKGHVITVGDVFRGAEQAYYQLEHLLATAHMACGDQVEEDQALIESLKLRSSLIAMPSTGASSAAGAAKPPASSASGIALKR